VAQAAARLGLRYVVVTSVTRDDLLDGGAAQFAATVRAVRRQCPEVTVELLIPDFGGTLAALRTVLSVRPDVLNHNMETVSRLYSRVRPGASYRRSLSVLAWARRWGVVTKSGLMLGLGETREEVLQVMRDLRGAGCDILTLGQYLQPSSRQLPVVEYIPPEDFYWYEKAGEKMGFSAVVAGPLVRSSHRAAEVWAKAARKGG
jgi:lipoic acid synthetase